jgi:hypothetical protein
MAVLKFGILVNSGLVLSQDPYGFCFFFWGMEVCYEIEFSLASSENFLLLPIVYNYFD